MSPRTIIVGDVHGCADELEELLTQVAFSRADSLVLVGDLVAKGPKPRQVIETVVRAGGVSVLGNHEARLLRQRARRAEREIEADQKAFGDGEGLRALARELDQAPSDHLWAYLEAMPLWLDRSDHGVRVVHAAVVPEAPIEATSEQVLLHGRTIRPDGTISPRRDDGLLWGAAYSGPPHVCFGHNALAAPQLHPWATGLDTGCVYGGRLTALVLAAGQPVPSDVAARRSCLVSVPAARAYARM